MTETARIQSFTLFWDYYLGEHRNPVCRRLHFVGTGSFMAVLLWAVVTDPVEMGSCVVAGLVVAFLGRAVERSRRAFPEVLAIVVLWVLGSPWVLVGIVVAYFFAWIGHFKVEFNRPATFQYPLWSLFADFKMVGVMVGGGLWAGDSLPLDAQRR